jgi:cell division topological specificity factor
VDLLKSIINRTSPKDAAKDRLKLILIHDRADLSPELLENIKEELLKVIANYAEIYQEDVEISLTRVSEGTGTSPALVANIPIKRVKS